MEMADFVLVHGASHGAWCWRDVLPRLAALGHSARAVDLPGHEDVTLEAYRDTVLAALTPGSLLVGHSLGGLSITLAGAARRTEIGALIYVAALVPDPGSRFIEFRKGVINPDLDRMVRREGGQSIADPERSVGLFASHCSAADQAFAAENLRPQPVSVMREPVVYAPPLPPRHYVLCGEDRVVCPAYQRAICAAWPEEHRHVLETGHSPFFSDPDGLVAAFDRIARTRPRTFH